MIDPPAAPIGFAALPEELRARIEAELAPGERLLWAAQPDPRRRSRRDEGRASSWAWTFGWTVLALVGLPLGFVPAFWLDQRANVLGVLGVLIGATAAVVAFFFWIYQVTTWLKAGPERRREGQELYALTDRRALIWRPVAGSAATSLTQIAARTVRATAIERVEYPDGSGDLQFSQFYGAHGVFRGIDQVREVDVLARRVLVDRSPIPPSPDPDDYEEPF